MCASLVVYDGATSIGGTKIHLQIGEKGFLLDFGTNYKRMSKFYEEYLRPRSTRGVHDYLEMGLIPPLDIYRRDIIPPDLELKKLQSRRVDGVFLTHAHMDHAGCIGLLNISIPVICTPLTATILKSIQDTGRADLSGQIVYATPREKIKGEERVFKSANWKSAPHVGRKFLLSSKPTSKLYNFWATPSGARELKSKPLEEMSQDMVSFKCWNVDHSIYGAAAFGLETENGWVVYTGDLRTHGKRGNETRKFVGEASKLDVTALIIEGTRIGRSEKGDESEENVFQNCLEAVEKERKLVIADFQPRHIERLKTFLKIAGNTGRSLVITTRDAYMLEALKLVDGVDRIQNTLIYRELKEVKNKWEENILSKFEDKLVDPTEIVRNPDSFILSFSFWDIKNLLDIKPEGGTYIYSSSEAFTEEAEFDFFRLWEWLKMFNFNVVGFQVVGSDGHTQPKFEEGYHASGHASSKELLKIIDAIGPKVVIPVHTEHQEFFVRNVKSCQVLPLNNGEGIDLATLKNKS